MGSNIAARRAAKAIRRKAIVAQKRKAEAFATSLPERVRRAASTPIQHCLLHAGLFETGIGTLVLTRGTSATHFGMAVFLVDVFCLGVKDVFFRPDAADEFAAYIETTGMAAPFEPADPSYGRKLLRDLVAWSRSIGFAPHPDFTAVEPIFGDVNASACDTAFQFGSDGKPLYLPGPSDSPTDIRRRLEHLRKHLGDDGFEIAGQAA